MPRQFAVRYTSATLDSLLGEDKLREIRWLNHFHVCFMPLNQPFLPIDRGMNVCLILFLDDQSLGATLRHSLAGLQSVLDHRLSRGLPETGISAAVLAVIEAKGRRSKRLDHATLSSKSSCPY